MHASRWFLIVVLLNLWAAMAGASGWGEDSLSHLGRAPLISEWERNHATTISPALSHECESLLNKTLDFQQKGKLEKSEKMYLRLMEDCDHHPQLLIAYGRFLEDIKEEVVHSLHQYIFALHQKSDEPSAVQGYWRVLPLVRHHEELLWAHYEFLVNQLSHVDVSEPRALELIDRVNRQLRIEQIYHTNAIEGNSMELAVVQEIIEEGPPSELSRYHPAEVAELYGVLEAYDFTSHVALTSYQSFLAIQAPQDLTRTQGDNSLELSSNTYEHLLSIPPVTWLTPINSVPPETLELVASDCQWELEHFEHPRTASSYLLLILQIHQKILRRVQPEIAGLFRSKAVSVGGYVPPDHEDVPYLMNQFALWLERTATENHLHPLERAALAHFQLTWVHPFADGNGRTARMLMNLLLMERGYPALLIELADRETYFTALRKSQETEDTRPFIYFLYQVALRSTSRYLTELDEFL